MKRVITFIMVIVLTAFLCACGQKISAQVMPSSEYIPQTTVDIEPEPVIEESERLLGIIVDDTSDFGERDVISLCETCGLNYYDFTDYIAVFAGEQEMNSAAAAEMVANGCGTIIFAAAGTSDIAETISLEYPNVKAYVAENQSNTGDDSLSGILVESRTGRYSTSGNITFTIFTITLDVIDPDTGGVTHLRTFSNENTRSCESWSDYGDYLSKYSSDLTKLAAIHILDNGESHVGWIDENGIFTDVTEIITPKSDFGALTKHDEAWFGPDDYFYFRDQTESTKSIKRVPLNNLMQSEVEIMYEGEKNTSMLPDGSIIEIGASGYSYYDSSMAYPAGSEFSDWVSENECVGVKTVDRGVFSSGRGIICRYLLNGNKDPYDWYEERTEIIPNIEGRDSRNPIVSPDSSTVAFISGLLSNGAETSYDLFLVPLDGGEPTKVPTNYTFSRYETTLIDWR